MFGSNQFFPDQGLGRGPRISAAARYARTTRRRVHRAARCRRGGRARETLAWGCSPPGLTRAPLLGDSRASRGHHIGPCVPTRATRGSADRPSRWGAPRAAPQARCDPGVCVESPTPPASWGTHWRKETIEGECRSIMLGGISPLPGLSERARHRCELDCARAGAHGNPSESVIPYGDFQKNQHEIIERRQLAGTGRGLSPATALLKLHPCVRAGRVGLGVGGGLAPRRRRSRATLALLALLFLLRCVLALGALGVFPFGALARGGAGGEVTEGWEGWGTEADTQRAAQPCQSFAARICHLT